MYKKVLIGLISSLFLFSLPVKALSVLSDGLVDFAPNKSETEEVQEVQETGEVFISDSVCNIVQFVELSNQIGDVSSTIIPNKLVAENKDGDLRQLSSEVILNVERISLTSNNTVRFVIGDAKAVTEEEYENICRIVQTEAGNQDIVGKVLIANVIFNRVASSKFPNDVSSVILSPGQFSPVSNGSFYSCKVSDETRQAVEQALNGVDYSDGALYFMARSAAHRGAVTWFDTALTYLFKHGGHEFFK